MKQSTASIAYATEEGVFCYTNLQGGVLSARDLGDPVRTAYSKHRPFAVYYNNRKPNDNPAAASGDDSGMIFSKKEECAADETVTLNVKADNGSCRDFQNSMKDYANKTPGSDKAEFIHLGENARHKCKKSIAMAKNNSKPEGDVKAAGRKAAVAKAKAAHKESKEDADDRSGRKADQ